MATSWNYDHNQNNSCGLFNCRPSWLQRFLSYKSFIVVYLLLGISQSMIFGYLSVVLSTVEKQFGVKSAEIAWVYSGNEISQICFIVFLPFVGRVKKRPLVMGLASVISASGMFLIILPYVIGRGQDIIKNLDLESETLDNRNGLCYDDNDLLNHQICDGKAPKDWISVIIIFIGIFTVGVGSTGIFSFGIPYIDDNTQRKESPLALSSIMAGRIVGPTCGYLLGSFTLRVYVNPGSNYGGLTEQHPLWIGAWWMGFAIVGTIVLFISPLMTLFPPFIPPPKGTHTNAELLSKNQNDEIGPTNMVEWWRELLTIAKRLFPNKVFVFSLLSSIFGMLAIVGFAQFLPKYIEFVFRKRASTSGLFGPLAKSISSMVGVVAAGYVIGKWRPRARFLSAWAFTITLVGVVAFSLMTRLGCDSFHVYGTHSKETEAITFNNLTCNSHCDCSSTQYDPICSADGITVFFSPCQAGCTGIEEVVVDNETNTTIKMYLDCKCVASSSRETEHNLANPWPAEWPSKDIPSPIGSNDHQGIIDYAFAGYCPSDCSNQFNLLMGMTICIGLIVSTGKLPNFLIFLRSIDQKDKAAAVTITISSISAFALLPSPIIFGSIYDKACTTWAEECGETLNCLAYNIDVLRQDVGALSGSFMAIAFLCDVVVWYYVKDISMYNIDEDVPKESDLRSGRNDESHWIKLDINQKCYSNTMTEQ